MGWGWGGVPGSWPATAPLLPCDGARWPGASPSDGATTHSFAWWVFLAGFLHWGWEVREGARERR